MLEPIGWLVNLEKSELDPKQVFAFVGYQFDLKEGMVRSTLDLWQILRKKIRELLADLSSPATDVPILDLSNLNKFLKVEKFKMETPETNQLKRHL